MRKIISISLFTSAILFSKPVTTIMPYGGLIDYGANSAKKSGKFGGIYFSQGTLNYLGEFSYVFTNLKYNNSNIKDLNQHDLTLVYSFYKPKYMYKFGGHYIDTTDKDLGDGFVGILGLGGYKSVAYNKHFYGADLYLSHYKDAKDKDGRKKGLSAIQLSPYYTYSKALGKYSRNNITLRLNYMHTSFYDKKNFYSIEAEDTFYYKKFSLKIFAYKGNMKSAVKDGGHSVQNNQDVMKYGYGAKGTYSPTTKLSIGVGASRNHFRENRQIVDTKNTIGLTSVSYTY